mmetsp:Transcript_1794/g.3760  ORF Transcript_1794/g.3760 Transcript_1794/m.3760 type:complete len:114 (-) Transcript_1794:133-474(-)
MPCGPRILTMFIYLSDVASGGETYFPRLNCSQESAASVAAAAGEGAPKCSGLRVSPKKGAALLWPSVLSQDPTAQDGRTNHEALPVVEGVKLAANAWIHQYDFHTPNKIGCTG